MGITVGQEWSLADDDDDDFLYGWLWAFEPEQRLWLAAVGMFVAPAATFLAFGVVEHLSLALGPASTPLVAFLVRWAALILVVPALVVAGLAASLARHVARQDRDSGLRVAGNLISLGALLLIALSLLWTVSALEFNPGP